MSEQLQHKLHQYFQRLLLHVPVLSQVRLASDKVMAFLRVWHYLERAGIRGDYLEFGVFKGMSFDLSLRSARKFYGQKMLGAPRFFAFDSFEGLPVPDSDKDADVFQTGTYAATLNTFQKNIRGAARGWTIEIVPGFFDQSLTPSLYTEKDLQKTAFVNIDCDLYPSTWQVLTFITPLLQTGTVLYFDDWYFSHGDMTLGEAGACYEWLAKNPQISLTDFGDVGIMGKMFIVGLQKSAPNP